MSRSFHITSKDIRGLTKAEIDQQLKEPNSNLRQFANKSLHKKNVIKKRKEKE